MTDTSHVESRTFTTWLHQNKCSIIFSSYKKHKVFCLGVRDNGNSSLYFCNIMRPMGLAQKGDSIYISEVGNIHKYVNIGDETHEEYGYFDAVFYNQATFRSGDCDVHDLCVSDSGEIFFTSALFNCICKPSMEKSFEVYWIPPWITKNEKGLPPAEDRCHINGLCLKDGKPKYITASCTRDYFGAWREHHGEGVVYDVENSEIVCEGLWAPHSPKIYKDRLWIAEAGTGHFGYVEDKEFIPKKFLPGFIRGITFYDNFALILTSFDRHDYAFKDLPLGGIIEKKGQQPHAGITIINMDTMDIEGRFEFLDKETELYDIICVRNIRRPRIIDHGENTMLKFHL